MHHTERACCALYGSNIWYGRSSNTVKAALQPEPPSAQRHDVSLRRSPDGALRGTCRILDATDEVPALRLRARRTAACRTKARLPRA